MSLSFRLRPGAPNDSLTEQQAYLALDLFLAQIAARGDLPASEVSSWVNTQPDGESVDPAMWQDWLTCVRAALGLPLGDSGDTFGALGNPQIEDGFK
jgi:hypothetical protein